ncbi:zinc transporter ZupT [Candidatus Peregrinibacteria bacterium]|nr:zinc transporter ZupT [Candidatus Peregrinibacteria bacterium]
MIETNTVLLAFGLTVLAGLSTGVGSMLAFVAKRTNTKLLSVALGFSAGVMIYVSFVEIFPDAREYFTASFGEAGGAWAAALSFFAGIALVAIIDCIVPSFENPHEVHTPEEMRDKRKARRFKRLHRVGMFTAVAIAIHNFPEGLITFMGTLSDVKLGIALAIAIAIHNVPEGIAVSIPIYYGTGSKKKAFFYSLLSGFAEPVGALFAFFFLANYMTDMVFGIMFGVIAGIMVYISLDELLPSSQKYGHHHCSIYGLISGMALMAISLLMV